MSKKAKYIGGYDGLTISFHDDAGVHAVTVERDHELPAEADDGTPIPASVRDELIARDDWTEVKRDSGKGD